MNKKNIKYILALVGILAIVAIFKFELFPNKKEGGVVVMSPIYLEDFNNDKVLVGASHNVFVGKVIRQVGGKSVRPAFGAETQFEVHVVYNIKGDLKGNVVVDQVGGFKNGKLYVVDGDLLSANATSTGESYLLQRGATYLFATRFYDKENWYTVSAPYRWQLITKDEKLGDIQLSNVAKEDKRVKELEAAYPKEMLSQSDIANGTAYNSYVSLHGEEVHSIPMSQHGTSFGN